MARAEAHAARGEKGAALADARAAVYLKPGHARGHAVLGAAQMGLFDFMGAMASLQKGCKANAKDADALRELRDAWVEAKNSAAVFRRASRLRHGGDAAKDAAFAAAREPCVHAIRSLAAADRAEAYRQLAAIHTGYDRHADARALLDAAVDEAEPRQRYQGRRCPTPPCRCCTRARSARRSWASARAPSPMPYGRARARPGMGGSYVSVGRAYAALGDWEKATTVVGARALAEQPGNTLLRRDLERAKMEARTAAARRAATARAY